MGDTEDIIRIARNHNLTAYEIAENTGLSEPGIRKILQGKTKKPSPGTIKLVLDFLDTKSTNSSKTLLRVDEPHISYGNGVPYYDVDFIGGFDQVMNDQSINPAFYINFQPFNDADCWVNISGESMSPIISHGDIVALKRIKSWKEFLLMGEIYAIVTPEFRTVKRLTKGETIDSYTLVPYSKDPVFAEQQIPKHLISHIFKVKGSIKKFF